METKKSSNKKGKILFIDAKVARGDTIRASLFKDSFLGKIRDVERYTDGSQKETKTTQIGCIKQGKRNSNM